MCKKLLFFSLLIVLAASCRSAREIGSTMTDSVRIERLTEYRDTTIQVPADSSWLQALIECDSNGHAYLREILAYKAGDQAIMPIVRIVDNTLQVDCICDSLAIYQKISKVYDHTIESRKEKETVTVEVNRLTWWQRTQVYGFRILAVVVLLFLAIKFLKYV